jgi:DNA-binding transcriptional ArsR family regulator
MVMHAEAFVALADPTRLRIVEELRKGERAVNDLVATADIHQSGVSRHLRILHDAGFVRMRPEGQQRFYSLRGKRFRELDEWLQGYRALWEARLDRLEEELARRKRRKP